MRDFSVIASLIVFSVCIGAAILLYAVNSRGSAPGAAPAAVSGTPVSFSVLSSGDQSAVTTRRDYLITSDNDLRALWKLITTDGQPPQVDFSKYSVIAVFAGAEPTLGYSIAVTGVTDGQERMVNVQITSPGASCGASQVTTSPYEVVELPVTSLSFTHRDSANTTSCLY